MLNRLHEGWERLEQGVLPVARWEMRAFMRGNRAPGTLFLCTGIVIGFGLILLQWKLSESVLSVEVMAAVGRSLFTGIVLLEVGLAVLLAPLLAGGLIEREYGQKTLDDLMLTRLTGMAIVLGKLVAGLGFFAMTVVCTLPLLAVAFAYGGVSPAELFGSQFFLLALAGYFGAAGICHTAHYRRPAIAMATTWFITPFTLLMLLPFQFAVFFTVILSAVVLDRTKRLEDRFRWGRSAHNAIGILYMVLAAVLLPVLIISSFTCLNPPAVLIVLLNRELSGYFDPSGFFALMVYLWWLVPFFSAAMLAYGAHTMLEDAADKIRAREKGSEN